MGIILESTDKLEMVVGTAADLDTICSYMDATQAAGEPVVQGDSSGSEMFNRTTAATHDLCSAPAASEMRMIQTLSIFNKDAVDASDVTVQIDRSATDYVLHKANLLPLEALTYDEGLGRFEHQTALDAIQYVRKSAQQTFAATTFADITGMGFAVAANRVYEFDYDIQWRSATATVGVGLAVNGPASPTSIQGTVIIIGAQAAGALTDIFSAGFVAYDTPNLTSLTTNATTVTYAARVYGIIEVGGTAGTLIPRWRSETATNTTVEVGSTGTLKLIK